MRHFHVDIGCCPCLSCHLGGRLNCAEPTELIPWHKLEQSNKGLCARFDIQTYPTLYWGPPEILASGGGFGAATLGLESVDGGTVNTAEKLLHWINKRINK